MSIPDYLVYPIFAFLVAGVSPVLAQPSGQQHHTRFVLPVGQRHVIEAVALYSFRATSFDATTDHRPLVCFIVLKEGGGDTVLIREMKVHRIKVDAAATMVYPKTGRFHYVQIRTVKMLSARRACVLVNLATDFDPPIVAESYGTIYLNYVRHKWVVDKKDSRIKAGD